MIPLSLSPYKVTVAVFVGLLVFHLPDETFCFAQLRLSL